MTLAAYLSELTSLIEQLDAAVRTGDAASGGQLFEWRIRARILEDKLTQAAKPPKEQNPESEEEPEKPAISFSTQSMTRAQQALSHASGLRAALQNRKWKAALESARAIERLTA